MYIITIILFLFLSSCVSSISKFPLLIVVSYDAFRYNYFDKNANPFLLGLKNEGTSADYLKNVFPTKTFPNHQSIATGLYPEYHGVVGNSFYDPDLKKILHMGPDMYSYNKDKILPIWTWNEKAGNGRHSGVMMWPGSEFEYGGIKPTHIKKWDPNVSWSERVDIALSWMLDKTKPANLIMLYVEEPDSHSHKYGPDSLQVLNLLKQLDDLTKYLHDKLRENGLSNKVNVVHVSDHGMTTVKPPQFLNITQYLEPNTYIIADTSPCLHFVPNKGKENEIYNRLKTAEDELKHFKVYKKDELLPKWHYKNNNRIPSIFALADPGYGFQDLYEAAIEYNITVTPKSEFGVHGYDNDFKDMYPIFIAKGPAIKVMHKVPPFSTLDLYNLFSILLNLKPNDNNGTLANIRDILQPVEDDTKFLIQKSKINMYCIIKMAILEMGYFNCKTFAMEWFNWSFHTFNGINKMGIVFTFLSAMGCAAGVYILYQFRKCRRRQYPTTTFENILNDMDEHNIVEAQHLLESEEI